MTEVRGRAIKSIQTGVKKKFGQEGFDRWLDAISFEAYSVYSGPININDWFPLKTMLIEPMANIAHLFYKWDLKEAAWDLGRFSADFGLKGPARLFFKIGSTKFLIHKAAEIMSHYYRPSEMGVTEYKDGFVLTRITKFPDIDKTTEYRIAGWMERALEINGNKNVEVEITKSLANFEPYTEFKATWTTK